MEPPPIATERTVRADYAMAGNNDRSGIGRTRPRYGARGGGPSKPARHLAVRTRRAEWYGAQRLPDAALERGSSHVGGQIELRLRAGEVPDDRAHPLGIPFRAAANLGVRILLAKGGGQRFILVPEIDGGDTAVRRGYQHAAQRAIGNRVGNLHATPAAAVRGRRHAELCVRLLVEAARRAISRFIECGCHVSPLS